MRLEIGQTRDAFGSRVVGTQRQRIKRIGGRVRQHGIQHGSNIGQFHQSDMVALIEPDAVIRQPVEPHRERQGRDGSQGREDDPTLDCKTTLRNL